jgi:hypothetical protein
MGQFVSSFVAPFAASIRLLLELLVGATQMFAAVGVRSEKAGAWLSQSKIVRPDRA